MNSPKTLYCVQLQSCCLRTVSKIRQKEKLSKALRYWAPAGIFAQMFIGPPRSEMATLYAVSSMDWKLLAETIINIDTITKRAILNDVAPETVDHVSGQLGEFWHGVYAYFGGK